MTVRKPEDTRLTKIAKQDVKQVKGKIKKVKKNIQAKNPKTSLKPLDKLEKRLTKETMGGKSPEWAYGKAKGGTVRLKSGGPVVDSYDY